MPDPITNDLLNWLLAGDVAIQYQVYRDLLDEERPDLRVRIGTEGWGRNSWALASRQAIGAGGFTNPSGFRPITRCLT